MTTSTNLIEEATSRPHKVTGITIRRSGDISQGALVHCVGLVEAEQGSARVDFYFRLLAGRHD
jgi:hypothetical protein